MPLVIDNETQEVLGELPYNPEEINPESMQDPELAPLIQAVISGQATAIDQQSGTEIPGELLEQLVSGQDPEMMNAEEDQAGGMPPQLPPGSDPMMAALGGGQPAGPPMPGGGSGSMQGQMPPMSEADPLAQAIRQVATPNLRNYREADPNQGMV